MPELGPTDAEMIVTALREISFMLVVLAVILGFK